MKNNDFQDYILNLSKLVETCLNPFLDSSVIETTNYDILATASSSYQYMVY